MQPTNSRNALVIGYGSIGSRHARILESHCKSVSLVTKQDAGKFRTYDSIVQAFSRDHFDYVVIANNTSDHFDAYRNLVAVGYTGALLIEKPVFDKRPEAPISSPFSLCGVGYNLRFLPVLQRLKELLGNDTIVTVNVYVGQYLPSWRPKRANGTDSYSAKKKLGGGVLRDLSHEIDYIQWIFGEWTNLTALGGKISDVTIDSDDAYSILLKTKRCSNVVVHMNYLNRSAKRFMIVNSNKGTWIADLITGQLEIQRFTQDEQIIEKHGVNSDFTYSLMHKHLLAGETSICCTLNEAMQTLAAIEACEVASSTKTWISAV
ncbi:MAG TPA: Gfo/Idh/MocA family oxidoreductase [Oligoflexia bacterium]|nr:Gfo/Idh/MocA family oxidoreductase [Oligoflexia bacterium]